MEWRPPLLYAYPLGHRVPAILKIREKSMEGLVETEAQCATRCVRFSLNHCSKLCRVTGCRCSIVSPRYSIPLLYTCSYVLYRYSILLLCTVTLYRYSIPVPMSYTVLQTVALYRYCIPLLYTCSYVLYRYSKLLICTVTLYRYSKLLLHTVLYSVTLHLYSSPCAITPCRHCVSLLCGVTCSFPSYRHSLQFSDTFLPHPYSMPPLYTVPLYRSSAPFLFTITVTLSLYIFALHRYSTPSSSSVGIDVLVARCPACAPRGCCSPISPHPQTPPPPPQAHPVLTAHDDALGADFADVLTALDRLEQELSEETSPRARAAADQAPQMSMDAVEQAIAERKADLDTTTALLHSNEALIGRLAALLNTSL